jgi:hypothetical protein
MELWWLSTGEPCRVTTVVFPRAQESPFPWLEFGIKLFDVQLQTLLAPVVMLNASRRAEEVSPERHGQCLLRELQLAQAGSSASGWLEVVYRHVKYAIREVISRAMAERI